VTEDLMTVPEVAATLRLHPQTIRRWIKAGTLPAARIGRDYRVSEAAVRALLDGESA
jgi:excisionase family DNA binding protein